jgi:uncharacterized protein
MSGNTAIIRDKRLTPASKVALIVLKGYQTFISPLLHSVLGLQTACRQMPTCSEYAQDAFRRYGFGRGMILSIRRLINCQPFFKI